MNYAILTLVYLLGIARMFYQAMAIDTWNIARHGHLGKLTKFRYYLILCVFWPITMWVQMYFRWLDVRDMTKEVTNGKV